MSLTLGEKVRMEGMFIKDELYQESSGRIYTVVGSPKKIRKGKNVPPEAYSYLIQYEDSEKPETALIRDHENDVLISNKR
jgi:hypothetical protein